MTTHRPKGEAVMNQPNVGGEFEKWWIGNVYATVELDRVELARKAFEAGADNTSAPAADCTKLREALENYIRGDNFAGGYLCRCRYHLAIEALRASEKPQAWISVKERLPEENQETGIYLIFIDHEKMLAWASLDEDNQRFYDSNYSSSVDSWNVVALRHWAQNADWLTHWQPLPSAPISEPQTEGK
jgi:Protein of unknown function (DUF551)